VEYLDSLARESADDAVLAVEVAGAYRKLAEISGDTRGAHLGDASGARRNAMRAAALLEGVESREPGNIQALREHRVVSLLLGRLRLEAGDAAGSEDTAKAAGIAQRITSLPGAGIEDRRNLGATLAEYGGILAVVKNDQPAAAAQLARATGYLEALVRENPRDIAARASLAYAYERAAISAEATARDEEMPRAIELLEKSIAASQSVVRDDPARASHAQTLVKRYVSSARVRHHAGDVQGALVKVAQARALAEKLVEADPRNVGHATILVGVLAMASAIEQKAGRHEQAIALAREAIAADARLPPETRAGLVVRETVVGARRALGAAACAWAGGESLPRARRIALLKEGRSMLQEGGAFKRELLDRGIDAIDAASALREIDAETRDCDASLARLGAR
jgi:tetratricopeptide (TPR) repeat protein